MISSHAALSSDVNWKIYETFFQVVELMLSKQISLVVEAAFQHKLWAPKLQPLLELSRTSILICTIDPFLARSRFIERVLADPMRERFHGDAKQFFPQDNRALGVAEAESQSIEQYQPPELPVPTLYVDTTDKYQPSIEEIVSFVLEETLI